MKSHRNDVRWGCRSFGGGAAVSGGWLQSDLTLAAMVVAEGVPRAVQLERLPRELA